ncbi:MAG TPA: hypothetical protein VF875_02180 [Anaeromyxobacter sp.]
MSGLLFVSQAMLDSWAEVGKIDFVGNVMTLLAGEGKGRSYALDPAVRFMKVLGGEQDPNALLHKVKSLAHLKELGAEPAGDSCILGDFAYEVQPGFLAEASALQAVAAAKPVAPLPAKAAVAAPAARGAAASSPAGKPGQGTPIRSKPLGIGPLPKDLEEKRKEAEALARFLLDNLS